MFRRNLQFLNSRDHKDVSLSRDGREENLFLDKSSAFKEVETLDKVSKKYACDMLHLSSFKFQDSIQSAWNISFVGENLTSFSGETCQV